MPSRRPFWYLGRRPETVASDVNEELQLHLEMRVEELKARGCRPPTPGARHSGSSADLERTREYCRQQDQQKERRMRRVPDAGRSGPGFPHLVSRPAAIADDGADDRRDGRSGHRRDDRHFQRHQRRAPPAASVPRRAAARSYLHGLAAEHDSDSRSWTTRRWMRSRRDSNGSPGLPTGKWPSATGKSPSESEDGS